VPNVQQHRRRVHVSIQGQGKNNSQSPSVADKKTAGEDALNDLLAPNDSGDTSETVGASGGLHWYGYTDEEYAAAAKRAKSSGKMLFLFSKAPCETCWKCKRLRNIFNTAKFQRYAQQNLVLVKIDLDARYKLRLEELLKRQEQERKELEKKLNSEARGSSELSARNVAPRRRTNETKYQRGKSTVQESSPAKLNEERKERAKNRKEWNALERKHRHENFQILRDYLSHKYQTLLTRPSLLLLDFDETVLGELGSYRAVYVKETDKWTDDLINEMNHLRAVSRSEDRGGRASNSSKQKPKNRTDKGTKNATPNSGSDSISITIDL
jgi:hypothetical protein